MAFFPMEGMGISCFFGAAMKRTGVSGRAKGSTGINWSALYPADGWEWLKTDQTVPRRPRRDGQNRGRAKSDRAGPTAVRPKRLKP